MRPLLDVAVLLAVAVAVWGLRLRASRASGDEPPTPLPSRAQVPLPRTLPATPSESLRARSAPADPVQG
ncbi:hypothetical protein ICW40_19260, partial [Actinotalea ferrariae]|uniref:hypothetical protein n=1 Tax=Actinotalea ferrariae TaxID=1386098 RepID=UPI001C8BF80F